MTYLESILCPNILAEKDSEASPKESRLEKYVSHPLESAHVYLQDTLRNCFNTQNILRAQDAAFCLLRETQHWLGQRGAWAAQGNQTNTSPSRTSSGCNTHQPKLMDFGCSNSLHPARICNLQRHILKNSTQNKTRNLEGAARRLLTLHQRIVLTTKMNLLQQNHLTQHTRHHTRYINFFGKQ